MRLTIYAGRKFAADFTVVDSGGISPQVLSPGDIATFTIVGEGKQEPCIPELTNVPLSITLMHPKPQPHVVDTGKVPDYDNGTFELHLSEQQTALLTQRLGFEEDHYSPISNYKGYIEFFLKSGDRQAMVDLYVKEVPCNQTVKP